MFRYWKVRRIGWGVILFLLLLLVNGYSYAQTEQEALTLINNASDKLVEALKLFEEIPITNSEAKQLTSEMDLALQLIQDAKSKTIEN